MIMKNKIAFENPETHDEFMNIIKTEYTDYDLEGKYSMMNGWTKFKHLTCGTVYRATPYQFIFYGKGCPECNDDVSQIYKDKEKRVIQELKDAGYNNHLEFVKKVTDKHGVDKYVVTGRYIKDIEPVEIFHLKCNNKFKKFPNDIIENNILCPHCETREEWNIEKVKKHIKEMTNGEFEVVGKKYVTIDTPIEIKHKKCGKKFKLSPNVFMKCPKCKVCETDMSLNEKIINDYLIKNKINFERQYAFKDCKKIKSLKFDFALFNKQGILKCLIEYDGEQHYRNIFGEESFLHVLLSDDIKNKYCKDNNIQLVRVPYWESENLKEIIDDIIKYYKVRR